jgi:hypothetical protein
MASPRVDGAMRDRSEDVRIKSCTELAFGIELIALTITVQDRTQLPDVGHDHFMAKLLQSLADQDRVCPTPSRVREDIGKPLIDRLRCRSERTRSVTSHLR